MYQRAFPAGPYSCWDGRQWRYDAVSPDMAALQTAPSGVQAARWRGLSEPPPEHCLTCRGHGVVDHGDDDASREPLIDPCPDC
ncbi:hypothetical protein AAW51_2936 [Caldimonas brevitalea]|uniref:Uncharacterized protein n=1 Tax=Caldimonas brevitalea TaxID=413882 RepID=A0A0G3BJR4_9BURK|nr:hypothetical protein AAW51_2936 [Caldimonas brevitalea]